MTDSAAQQVLLPGLLASAGLTGRDVLAGGVASGRLAAQNPPGHADTGFQQRLRELLAGSPETGAGFVTASAQVDAEQPALFFAAAPAAPAGTPVPGSLPAGGKTLPGSGNLLPLARSELRNAPPPAVPSAQPDDAAVAADVTALPRATPPADNRAAGSATGGAGVQADLSAALSVALAPDRAGPQLPEAAAQRQGAEHAMAQVLRVPGKAGDVAPTATAAAALQVAETLQRSMATEPGARAATGALAEMPVRPDTLHQWLELSGKTSARLTATPELSAPTAAGALARGSEIFTLPLTQLTGGESASRDLPNLPPLRLQTGDAGQQVWSAGLGQRLLMMADNGVEVARLRLSPAHLGPLEIHVNVEDDRAQVWFGAQHSQTREALEAALPRLREMFAAQGLELTQADVEARGDQAAGHDAARDHAAANLREHEAAGLAAFAVPTAAASGPSSGLDIYV